MKTYVFITENVKVYISKGVNQREALVKLEKYLKSTVNIVESYLVTEEI